MAEDSGAGTDLAAAALANEENIVDKPCEVGTGIADKSSI
jgi:hypothetical protein